MWCGVTCRGVVGGGGVWVFGCSSELRNLGGGGGLI